MASDTLASKATELFNLCDHENKGYITEKDLTMVVEELGLHLTQEQITLTFVKLDKDGNNHLTLAEFISGFDLFLGAERSDTNSNTLDYSKGHQLFNICDRELKGFITKSDLERLSDEFQLTKEQLGDLFESLDLDGNGRLTLEEFVAGFGEFLDLNDTRDDETVGTVLSPVENENTYESDGNFSINSPMLAESMFEEITEKIGNDFLYGVLSKDQLLELWRAISSNEIVGFEKLTEFLSKVSQEIKRSHAQAKNVEETLKGQVEAREYEIQKLYEKMDDQLQEERMDMSSHHEKLEKAIREEFQTEMAMKEKELQELLDQQKELEEKIHHLNRVDADVREENSRLHEANIQLQNELDESSSSLENTKSYVQHLQSLTNEEKQERQRTAMTIAQGMQKEQDSLKKQLDMLKEMNQKLIDQKDVIEAAHEANSPAKKHKVVTRKDSYMSQYFDVFDRNEEVRRRKSTLESVNESTENIFSPTPAKSKLSRQFGVPLKYQPSFSVSSNDGVLEDECEYDDECIFPNGEIMEPVEWKQGNQETMKVSTEKIDMAERSKIEQEFRRHKPALVNSTENKQSYHNETSKDEEQAKFQSKTSEMSMEHLDQEDGRKNNIPLSPRTSPVGTDTEIQAEEPKKVQLNTGGSNIQRIFKIVFVGDSGVGKSSFIHRYCYEIWKPSYTATIGVDFQVKSVQLGLKTLALQLWDTAGQERFRSITKQYFRKADGVVLLYDLSSESSFINIKSWMTSVEEAADSGCTVLLIGNKLDLCEENHKCRAVSYKNAEALAKDYGCLYTEASAKSGENVNEAMEILARRLQDQEDLDLFIAQNERSLRLDGVAKKGKCCGK